MEIEKEVQGPGKVKAKAAGMMVESDTQKLV